MKILFISSNLIGDSILSTGILSYITENNEKASITLITGPTAKEIFQNFPKVKKIIILKKMKFNLHWIMLWSKVFRYKWDLVVDLRSSLLSYFLLTKSKKIFINDDTKITQVEKLSKFIGAKKIKDPIIFSTKEDRQGAKSIIGNCSVIAIAPGGNWEPKIWPIENFLKLIIELKNKNKKNNIKFLIIGSKKEEKYYEYLASKISSDILINLMGKSLNLTFCCLKLCKVFIGNDSGLMHLSAASGINTIGLFGPTRDESYKPYGNKCYVLRTDESFAELRKNLKNFNKSLMTSINTNRVLELIYKNNLF